MNKNMAWPIGITVFLVLFAGGLIGFLFYSTSLRFDLVEEDYYQKGLQYQDRIEQKKRTEALSQPLRWKVEAGNQLHLYFPEVARSNRVEGQIHLFRPSDARMDRKFPLNLTENAEQVLNLKGFTSGLWRVKIQWQIDGKDYYYEEAFTLN